MMICIGGALSTAAPAKAQVPEQPPPPPPPRPQYSLPWQLRPAVTSTGVRSDTVFAFMNNPASGNGGFTTVTMLSGTYQIVPGFAPIVRLGLVGNSPPAAMPVAGMPAPPGGAVVLVNPVVGATYSLALPAGLRLAFFLGVTVPIGMGGGDSPNPDQAAAVKAGAPARSAMDNAMFSVNDFAVFPGIDFAFISHGFTAQVEATLFELIRVRGGTVPANGMPAKNPDPTKTNLTMGLHIGYFLFPELSIGAEIRHQRFLTTPKAVAADEAMPPGMQNGSRDTTTFAVGPRFHLKMGESSWCRPGIAYARGLDNPLSKQTYNIVQLDLPFVF